jgi:hypothetical protein
MMNDVKNLLLLTTLILVSCGGGGGDNNPTPSPPTPPVPAAEPPPQPPCTTEGIQLSTSCDDTTLVVEYADGQCGSYVERTSESTECGYVPPPPVVVLDVMVTGPGDRFEPVYVSIDYTIDGEPADYDTIASIGQLVSTDGGVFIYGDGSTGEGLLTVNEEEFLYTIVEEPRCEHTLQGYTVRAGTPSRGFIYYGEEDERIVAWELAFLYYRGDVATPIEVTVGSSRWNTIQKRVDNYNEIYERSGVHVRFILKRVFEGAISSLQSLESFGDTLDVDIVLGWPYTTVPDSCGVAFPNTAFRLGQTVGGFSRCDEMVDLHEIGHAVGLAHGPRNQYNPDTGYIFPEFGHGENDLCANTYDDIMSYGQEARFFGNSKLSCTEAVALGREISDNPSGYRSFSETAYAINRVRYDVSLIYPERDWKPEEDSVLQFIKVETKPTGRVPIID